MAANTDILKIMNRLTDLFENAGIETRVSYELGVYTITMSVHMTDQVIHTRKIISGVITPEIFSEAIEEMITDLQEEEGDT